MSKTANGLHFSRALPTWRRRAPLKYDDPMLTPAQIHCHTPQVVQTDVPTPKLREYCARTQRQRKRSPAESYRNLVDSSSQAATPHYKSAAVLPASPTTSMPPLAPLSAPPCRSFHFSIHATLCRLPFPQRIAHQHPLPGRTPLQPPKLPKPYTTARPTTL